MRLKQLCINRKELAEMLGVNYTAMCNTMSGYLANRPDIQKAVLSKLDELEASLYIERT